MLGIFGKKKIKESEIAKVFVGTVNEVAVNGFEEIVDFVKNNTHFDYNETLNSKANLEGFLFIVFTANLRVLEDYFSSDQLDRLRVNIITEFGQSIEGKDEDEVVDQINNYETFLSEIKNPNGDLAKLIAKAIFLRLNLIDLQNDNFKKLQEANPIVVTDLQELTNFFIWNWEDFFEKYKLTN